MLHAWNLVRNIYKKNRKKTSEVIARVTYLRIELVTSRVCLQFHRYTGCNDTRFIQIKVACWQDSQYFVHLPWRIFEKAARTGRMLQWLCLECIELRVICVGRRRSCIRCGDAQACAEEATGDSCVRVCVSDCAYYGEPDMCGRKRRKTHAVLRWEEQQMWDVRVDGRILTEGLNC